MVGLRATLACALIALATLLAPSAAGTAERGAGKQTTPKTPPNVVVIVTDDQTLESYREEVMPRTFAELGDRGTTFSEAIVSTPQCCPSRAGYLTGQYAHNNGVVANRPGYSLLKREKDVLPNWLRNAGYKTIHIGKYLNGYPEARKLRAGPGWDRWITMIEADYRRPGFSFDGRYKQRDIYLTTLINRQARKKIGRYAPRRKPFYMQVDQFAPHVGSGEEGGRCNGGPIPLPGDEALFDGVSVPATPAVEESDVSDKPEFIRRVSPPGADPAKVQLRYECSLESLAAVDRGVAGIVSSLRKAGELGRTMIVFTSDNGYSFGEHRMPLSKGLPYEEHVRVPLVIRPPNSFPAAFRRGATIDAPVANIDLAPTLLELADAKPCRRAGICRRMDGRSLIPLLRGAEPAWTGKRAIKTSFSVNFEVYKRSCLWSGFRTPERSVTEHLQLPRPGSDTCERTTEFETYDLAEDPWQLENQRPAEAADVQRVRSLARCSGIRGRDRALASRPFCE